MDVETVAARSYWHPNGYAKLVLADSPQGQTRLHVWTETGDGGDIHDHAWDYQSTVLAGALYDVRYQETAVGIPMWRHCYERIGDRRWTLTEPVAVQLATSVMYQLQIGDTTIGGPGTTHQFYVIQVPAVTLIRVGPVSGHSHVYRPDPQPSTVVPRTTTPADVAELLALAARLAPDLDLHTLVTG